MTTKLPPAPIAKKATKTAAKKTTRSGGKTAKKTAAQQFPTAEELGFEGKGLGGGELKLTVVDPDENLEYRFCNDDPANMASRMRNDHFQVVQNDHTASDIESVTTQHHAGTNPQGGARKTILMARHKSLRDASDAKKANQRKLAAQALDPKKQDGVTASDRQVLWNNLEHTRS